MLGPVPGTESQSVALVTIFSVHQRAIPSSEAGAHRLTHTWHRLDLVSGFGHWRGQPAREIPSEEQSIANVQKELTQPAGRCSPEKGFQVVSGKLAP